jgi:ribosome-binding factor A
MRDRRRPKHVQHEGIAKDRMPPEGADPIDDFGGDQDPKKSNHKPLQLCAQAAEALNLAFAGECRDAVLQSLEVAAVEPGGGGGALVVTVRPGASAGPIDEATAQERLERAAGFLRRIVAEAIWRKRAPDLVFRFAEREGDGA